jgi:phosphoglycolate phosphatase-like HAD superfamily hydrolase
VSRYGRRLLLWDIDGTLLSTGTIGRRAIMLAVSVALGTGTLPALDLGGKTDPQIATELMHLFGMSPAEIDALLPEVITAVEENLVGTEAEIVREGHLKPGVAELLERLADAPGVVQSLLTGNLAANAAVKVGAFGLQRWLDLEIGAYGSDHADRTELVPIALERARRLRGEHYEPDEVWVIGDTANDLACARAGGVRCLLVGTGTHGHEAVAGLDADAVLEDLSDLDAVLSALGLGEGSAARSVRRQVSLDPSGRLEHLREDLTP